MSREKRKARRTARRASRTPLNWKAIYSAIDSAPLWPFIIVGVGLLFYLWNRRTPFLTAWDAIRIRFGFEPTSDNYVQSPYGTDSEGNTTPLLTQEMIDNLQS
jgi:hypothetical protein